MRRPHRGAGDGRRGAPARARRDGRQHGRHQPRHGARFPASASSATIVDLDGPTFLAEDRRPGVVYADGAIDCGEEVWGGAGQARRMSSDRRAARADLVRPAARPHHPLPHQYVGAILLFRDAGAARLLHDDDAADRAGDVLAHLRHLYRLRLFHADHRRHDRRPLARQAPRGDDRRGGHGRAAIS